LSIYLQTLQSKYSCDLCAGSKVPDSTADDRTEEELVHIGTPKCIEQGDGNISLDGKEEINMEEVDPCDEK